MLISPNEINKILQVTGSAVTNRGKKYYENGKVKVTKIKYVSDDEFFAKAFVEGSSVYEVQIIKKNNMLKYKCECPKPYGRNTPCKHVIATLFDMYTNPDKYLNVENSGKIEIPLETKKYSSMNSIQNGTNILEDNKSEYIRYYENLELASFNINKSEEVKIIPKLSIYGLSNKYLKVSFSIGKDKKYILHDIFEFYEKFINNENYLYGKGLEFKHDFFAFSDNSKDILQYILEYVSTYKSLISISSEIKISKQFKSSIILKHGLLDSFFDIYKDKEVELENIGKIKLVEQDPILDFAIVEEDNIGLNVINTSEPYDIYYGTNNIYMLYQNKLYKCSQSFKEKMIPLLMQFEKNKNNLIHVLKNESGSFSNFVYPNIKDIARLEIDPKIVDKYKIDDLGVKLYLDIDKKSNIIANLKFCYKSIEFNPFDENAIIECNRNLVKEKKVKELFEKYNFSLNIKEKYLFLKDENSIYEFLTSGIEFFMQKFEVFVTDKLKNKQIIKNKNLDVGIRINNNLLEIDLENLDFDESEIKEIFNRYKLKKKYFRIKDGSFINLESSSIESLIKIHENFSVSEKEIASKKVKIPKYRAVALEKILSDDKSIIYTKDNGYKEIIKEVLNSQYEEYKIPQNLNVNLREYQKTGFNWLKTLDKFNFGGILADDMGLGKTLQIISLLLDEKNNNALDSNKDSSVSIVVCPTSLYLNWENEIKKYAPDLKVLIISGTQKEREKKISKISKYDVIITSYDLLKRDIEKYEDINFRYAIADEAQYIKNNNTKNAVALKKINASTRFALTGTPIENSISELWSIFDYIMPGFLYNYSKFKEIYETPIIKDEDSVTKEKLKNVISPFILRRTKKDVLKELPEKTEIVMYNEMEKEQLKIYKAYLADTKLKITQEIEENSFEKNRIKILALITRLRQICSHPSLFVNNFDGESAKLNQCIELLEDGINSGHKILLFSGFTSMFDIITKKLEEKNIKYYILTGKTDVNTRAKMVEEFNKNNDVKVFLISLKAGGTGLNLIGADMVIHYDPWWNLAVQNQATDRVYRIGQKNNVQVYKLITKDTIEEKILELQGKKKDLLDNIISNKETFINKLSKEEIMKLFEM